MSTLARAQRATLALVALIGMSAASLTGQTIPRQQPEPASASAALSALRAARSPLDGAFAIDAIRSMLTQKHSVQPPARLDSIARGLVRIAVESPPGDILGVQALSALTLSGSASYARVPYERAFARMVEVFRRAPDVGTRGAALRMLYKVDLDAAVAFWRAVATGEEPADANAELSAVLNLARDGGDQGRTILRELYEGDLVRNPLAREQLVWLAGRDFRYPDPQESS